MKANTETIIILLVATQFVISAAAGLAPRLRIPAPLILVAAGIAASAIPGVPDVVIDPDIILLGLLPPLLYASATSIPVVNLRREFSAVNGLSIVLVVLTSLALGAVFNALIPNLGLGWGVALGAILSPTDAVATTIFKGRGVPGRVALILDGESLLNDASALIVLRTAIVAASLGFAFWPTLGQFAWSIVVAIAVGQAAARLNLAIRKRVHEQAVNTVLSYTTPFLAAIPAELLHGSGLVAAVIAGFVVSVNAPRDLPPRHRVSDAQNWATIELGLEGAIFLTMGLQLATILRQLAGEQAGEGLGLAFGMKLAGLALLVTLGVRALYVFPLLWNLHRRAVNRQAQRPRFEAYQQDLEAGHIPKDISSKLPIRGEGWLKRLHQRGRRHLAELDYLAQQPLGRAEAIMVVWAGMRGAVTVAAVQLLPEGTPHRPLLVFIAFAVAAMSLLLQGGTIGLLVPRLFPPGTARVNAVDEDGERQRVKALIEQAGAGVACPERRAQKDQRLQRLAAQRGALLDARDDGTFSAEALEGALRDVDIDEIVLELHGGLTRNEGTPST